MALSQDDFNEYLKQPILFPAEFKEWVQDYFATNVPKLHVSQIFGFKLQSVKESETGDISALQAVTSTSYTAFSTDGPTFSNVPNGFYLLFFGATYGTTAGDPIYNNSYPQLYITPVLDGTVQGDGDGALLNAGSGGRVTLIDLTDQLVGGHTITFQYKLTGSSSVIGCWNRWAFLIKVITE